MKNETAGGMYFMAVVGAAVYYVRHAATFGMGVYGVIKAIGWPAVLMYTFLEYLHR